MSCRDDRRVGAERKEAVQIRTFSRGLARHGMTVAGRCKDACWARFYLTLCHRIFQFVSRHSPATFGTIQSSGFLSGTSSCLALFWLLPNPHTRPRPRKKLVPQLPGTI